MREKILVVYKSVTGFTREYAEMVIHSLSGKCDCTLLDIKNATAEKMSEYSTVIFGGRLHAGTVDGLKKAKQLFGESKASQFIVFATGAMPNSEESTIAEMWENNLSLEELSDIPHFYMQGGLRYERMPFPDKMMMKAFSGVMKMKLKKKKDKNESERQFEQMIAGSYDISDEKFIRPLVEFLRMGLSD